MTTSVIPKLESSDRPRSPVLFPQLSMRRPSEHETADRMRDLSDVWDVSQSGVPVEEDDVNNCTLDLSMRSADWSVQPSPSYPVEESNLMNVSSSCEEDRVAEAAEHPEINALNLSTCSDGSSYASDRSESNGRLPVISKTSGGYVSDTPENNVYLPVSSESGGYRASLLENNGCLPVRPENSDCNVSVKIENTYHYEDDVPAEPDNSSLVSIKPENNADDYETDDYENVIRENVRSEEASEVINVTETDNDDVINVTSTTQEGDPVDTPVSPEQEVVDVESYQPCVVDLTCEEEDDVDVVAVVEPVIFIGTGQGRRHRGHNPPPQVEDLTDAAIGHDPGETIDDDTNNNAIVQDERNHLERNHDLWRMMNPPEIDLQNPNLTFGSLLEQAHIETVEDNSIQQPHRPLATARRTYRELRRTTRRQRRSRSRSPNLFPDMDFDDNPPHIANLMNAIDDMMHDPGDWTLPLEAPNQLPLDANQVVAEEHHHRVARIPTPKPPPSPPPVEQPTISCLVCLDSIATINSSSRSLCSTVCGHVFCSACIEEVVKQRKQCPVCRKRLTKKQYHPLFI